MFADKYLFKNRNKPLIDEVPDSETGIIVVIPCLKEPDILQTLESINHCELPGCFVEVIVLVNHSEIAPQTTIDYNRNTVNEIQDWIAHNRKAGLRFFVVGPVELQKKWAGAGLARKKGMDEAIRRFNLQGKTDGILVSLDADTLVEHNYLSEIEKHFQQNPKQVGATIAFQHRRTGLEPRHSEGIDLYEKYLSYYKMALQFTGYPHAMFTVGSAFVVRAEAYVKRGGMNRRQAGEDFYFLQNLVQIGKVGEITTTTVYPSARLSNRVPFGTGPVLSRWMKGNEDLLKTYDFKSFSDLKQFFEIKSDLFRISSDDYLEKVKLLPVPVSKFLQADNIWEELEDLNKNCTTLEVFQNRFFQKFNAFRILKYLNFVSEHFYPKSDLISQITLLHKAMADKIPDNTI